jgi:CHAT domain-containing protein
MMDNLISRHENSILIEYFVAESKTIIFLLRKHELIVKVVPCLRGQMAYMVRKFRELVANQDDVVQISSWLSSKLVEPVRDYIIKNEVIRFVPHQVLHYLPLHALTVNDTNIINNNPVIYSPSFSILQFLINRTKKYSKECVVYGIQKDSSDKEIVIEATNIAKLYNTTAHINASKGFVSRNITSDLIHFACHGYFNHKDPLSSGILLNDGILTAREMLSRQIIPDSNMITLSACESGVNETSAGDEFIGLTRALLYGGPSSILVSLWEVETVSTMKLMIDFYKRIIKREDIVRSLQ